MHTCHDLLLLFSYIDLVLCHADAQVVFAAACILLWLHAVVPQCFKQILFLYAVASACLALSTMTSASAGDAAVQRPAPILATSLTDTCSLDTALAAIHLS